MSNWHPHGQFWVGSIVIFIVLLGAFPANLVLFSSPEESLQEEDARADGLKGTADSIQVPRLMEETSTFFSNASFDSDPNSTELSQEDQTRPNFAIGSQQGTGNGSYSATDLFYWNGTEAVTIQNSFSKPLDRSENITFIPPTSFTQENISFKLKNVESVTDWEITENDTTNAVERSSASFIAVGQQLVVDEDYINITSVTVRLYYYDYTEFDGDTPQGFLQIMDDDSDKPGQILAKIALESKYDDDGEESTSWKEYTFSNPVNLSQGTYYIVLNDTTDDLTYPTGDGRWGWWTVEDSINSDYDDWYQYSGGSWWKNPVGTYRDILCAFKYIVTDSSHNTKVFTDPTEINMHYLAGPSNTTLTSFIFEGNNTYYHQFTVSTSISFNLNLIMKCNYSNVISLSSTFNIENQTINNERHAFWNVTFSSETIDNTTYTVTNRTITIQSLQNDWNGSAIYLNGSLEFNTSDSGGLNSSVTYANKSSTMVINASSLSVAKGWNVSFIAPNYLHSFNLSLGDTPLTLPYKINVTDIINLTFQVEETGGNTSYWIQYPNGSEYKRLDFNDTHIIFNDLWDINDTIDHTINVNGTHELQAFWNNSDTTKVGTFIRTLDVFVNTSMTVEETPSKIITGHLFNLTVHYNTTHNSTGVNNASILIDTNWTSQVEMTQLQSHGVYNASLDTSGQTNGTTGELNITTEMPWFVNWTTTIHVDFVEASSLSVNKTNVVLQWRENATLQIKYNDSVGSPISGATVTVNGGNTFNIGDIYYYWFNTTDYPGVDVYPDILINATHENYSTQLLNVTLTITPGETNIDGMSDSLPLVNITGGVTQAYSASLEDNVTISLRYYHTLTDDTLNTSEPSITSPIIPHFDPVNESNYNWTITFNVTQTGNFLINISFNLANYNSSTFIFNLTVNAASTTIISEIDETDIYWNDSYDFTLVYQNVIFTENITSGVIITINDTTKVEYIAPSGDKFQFRFASSTLPVQSHAITINFSHNLNYFELSTIEVIFNVISRPTNVTGINVTSGAVLINGSSTYYRNYSPKEYDNFSISLRYYDNQTDQTIDVETDNITVQAHTSIVVHYSEDGSNNWTFIVNGSVLGTYSINITFSLTNYTSSTFTVILILQAANSSINNQSVDPGDYPLKITNRSAYYFWVNWTSQYGEPLNDSDGVDISYTIGNIGDIILYSTNPNTGNHTFQFYPTTIGPINATLTFQKTNYTATVFKINVTSIENTSFLVNTTVLVLEWRENYTLQIWFNDSTNSPIAGATISVDGDSENFTEVSGVYYYQLNTTKYGGVGFHSNLNVTAELLYHENRTWYFDLSITNGNTSISAFTDGTTVFNDTMGISQIFANSSADEINISLRYYHILTDETLDVIIPTVDSELNFTAPNEEVNYNWSVTINPNKTGVFFINFTFSLTNYNTTTFIFHLTVKKAGTAIYNTLPDGKEINYSTTFDFSLLYNNTDYNENITGLEEGSGITLNNSNIGFLNHSGSFDEIYWFQLNPSSLSVGSYSTEIIFTHQNFNTSLIILNFTVIASPTTINATDYLNGTILQNGTSTYYRNYSLNEYDNFSIWLQYEEIIGQTTVDVDAANITIEKNSTIEVSYWEVIKFSKHNWTFIFNGSALGTFTINITFSHYNHIDSTFTIIYVIQEADTKIGAQGIAPAPAQTNVTSGNTFNFWLVWQSQYNENLNDSDGVEGNGTVTDIVLLTTNSTTGNHTFQFTAPDIGIYTYNLTFVTVNYTKAVFFVRFNVTRREMILNLLSSSYDNDTTGINIKYENTIEFNIFLEDEGWGSPVNVSSDNITLPTDVSFVSSGPIGNHTFSYYAGLSGTVSSLAIIFVLDNYFNFTYVISFNVYNRFMFINDSLTYPTSGQTIDTLQYGELFYFYIFLMDNETYEPVNATIKPLPARITPIEVENGNHSFYYNASQIGDFFDLDIILNQTNYNEITYTISFTVNPREMKLDGILTTYDSQPATIDYLQYGDIFYFYVYLNDSRTNGYVNISNYGPLLSNLFFENFSTTKGHLFRYNALALGTHPWGLVFSLLNYNDFTYQIIFTTSKANSQLIFTSSTIATYYTINTDFYAIWQSIPNSQVSTSPLIRIDTADITIQVSPSEWSDNVNYQSVSNGNYTFHILANQSGAFSVTLSFGSSVFVNQSHQFTINILPVLTKLGSASLANNSDIGYVSPFYFSEQYNISVTWLESLTNSGILTTNPIYAGNGSTFISLPTTFADGTHIFSIDANALGTYQVSITLNIANFVDLKYVVSFTISKVPTLLHQASTANSTVIGETPLFNFSESHTISLIWLENLTLSGIECSNPNFDGNGTDYIFINPAITNGNHLFTIKADALGFYQVGITLSIANHVDLRFVAFFNVSIMCTNGLIIGNMTFSQSIPVEDMLHISGNETFLTFRNESVPLNNLSILMWMNGSLVSADAMDFNASQSWFKINFTTVGYQYGTYNLTLQLRKYGYQNQSIALWITLIGYEITIEVIIRPENIEQGEAIEIDVILSYAGGTGAGRGAGVTLASLEGVDVSFYIELLNENETTSVFKETLQTDALGQATYTLDGSYTRSAVNINNITVSSSAALSGLPSSFSVPLDILQSFKIEKPFINRLLDVLIPIALVGGVIAGFVIIVGGSGYVLNRKRKQRQRIIIRHDKLVEQSFEDIKSIRLIIARHQSGLQFYSEKTIADVQTDTDALSGMTTALSTFMKELSEGMSPGTEDHEQDEIEVMSREGLHMLVWHGSLSSIIIISEISLPDYFQDRLKNLGRELESKFHRDLEDFITSDQIPSNQVRKIVRKFIPLHYFSAFVLNEGVLTLESIKLSKRDEKMLTLIKQVKMEKEGMHYFFAEQIISHLSRHYKRSETIEFLDRSIELNLLVEMSQEDLLQIGK